MPSRNVAVQKDVYDSLKKEKRTGESFTSLFVRLLNQRGTLDEVRGAWGDSGMNDDLRRVRALRHHKGGARR
jgi:predicted CopG family antitoxin